MISDFCIKFTSHNFLTDEDRDKIILLKSQYWHYPKESHEKWIRENLTNDDFHLWIENSNGETIAYLNMVFLDILFGERKENVIGIGNVCVNKDFTGKGIGLLLMLIAKYYITCLNKRAVLLCKKSLTAFYQKSGWNEYSGKVKLKGAFFEEFAMFDKLPQVSSIEIERSF